MTMLSYEADLLSYVADLLSYVLGLLNYTPGLLRSVVDSADQLGAATGVTGASSPRNSDR